MCLPRRRLAHVGRDDPHTAHATNVGVPDRRPQGQSHILVTRRAGRARHHTGTPLSRRFRGVVAVPDAWKPKLVEPPAATVEFHAAAVTT